MYHRPPGLPARPYFSHPPVRAIPTITAQPASAYAMENVWHPDSLLRTVDGSAYSAGGGYAGGGQQGGRKRKGETDSYSLRSGEKKKQKQHPSQSPASAGPSQPNTSNKNKNNKNKNKNANPNSGSKVPAKVNSQVRANGKENGNGGKTKNKNKNKNNGIGGQGNAQSSAVNSNAMDIDVPASAPIILDAKEILRRTAIYTVIPMVMEHQNWYILPRNLDRAITIDKSAHGFASSKGKKSLRPDSTQVLAARQVEYKKMAKTFTAILSVDRGMHLAVVGRLMSTLRLDGREGRDRLNVMMESAEKRFNEAKRVGAAKDKKERDERVRLDRVEEVVRFHKQWSLRDQGKWFGSAEEKEDNEWRQRKNEKNKEEAKAQAWKLKYGEREAVLGDFGYFSYVRTLKVTDLDPKQGDKHACQLVKNLIPKLDMFGFLHTLDVSGCNRDLYTHVKQSPVLPTVHTLLISAPCMTYKSVLDFINVKLPSLEHITVTDARSHWTAEVEPREAMGGQPFFAHTDLTKLKKWDATGQVDYLTRGAAGVQVRVVPQIGRTSKLENITMVCREEHWEKGLKFVNAMFEKGLVKELNLVLKIKKSTTPKFDLTQSLPHFRKFTHLINLNILVHQITADPHNAPVRLQSVVPHDAVRAFVEALVNPDQKQSDPPKNLTPPSRLEQLKVVNFKYESPYSHPTPDKKQHNHIWIDDLAQIEHNRHEEGSPEIERFVKFSRVGNHRTVSSAFRERMAWKVDAWEKQNKKRKDHPLDPELRKPERGVDDDGLRIQSDGRKFRPTEANMILEREQAAEELAEARLEKDEKIKAKLDSRNGWVPFNEGPRPYLRPGDVGHTPSYWWGEEKPTGLVEEEKYGDGWWLNAAKEAQEAKEAEAAAAAMASGDMPEWEERAEGEMVGVVDEVEDEVGEGGDDGDDDMIGEATE